MVIISFATALMVGVIGIGYALWRFSCFDGNVMLMFYEKFGHQAKDLKNKTIWITGASSGIGEALAFELARVGSRLILSGTQTAKLEDVKRRCLASNTSLTHADVLALPMDMTDLASHQKNLDEVIERFGNLDILVNNAGRSQRGLFEDVDIEVDKANFEVNVFGLINLTRITVRHWLKHRQQGHIAVTSSGYGIVPGPTHSTYVATKYALHGYFESLRPELLTRGIVVSMVCPGLVATNLFDNIFTTKLGAEDKSDKKKFLSGIMTAERCAQLFAVAIANRVWEAWITYQPSLVQRYLATSLPSLFRWLQSWYMTEVRLRKMASG